VKYKVTVTFTVTVTSMAGNMSANNQEIESKFYIRNLQTVQARLVALGATEKIARAFEYNLRFDDPQNNLAHEHRVLRLRKSDDVRLTFKGPGEQISGAIVRTELELVVDDFEMALRFLEALGYQVVVSYEKYRAMYEFEHMLITLDELPYGNFVEIEAEKVEAIAGLAKQLGLKAEAAIPASYLGLFEHLRTTINLRATNLAFAEFEGLQITAEDLGVVPAD
jgi:adenylate cyclase class 2